MKAVIQVVDDCTLRIDDGPEPYSHIDKGLMILLGVNVDDTKEDAEKLAKKITTLRIFHDENDKMNLCCIDKEVGGKFMIVSQFTLCGDASQGRRPNMLFAARPEKAIPLYEYFSEIINDESKKYTSSNENFVVNGKFGADMKITFTNCGPMTFVIDSSELK